MHVLFLSKAFNDLYNPVSGVFVKEQAMAVASLNVKTGIIAVNFTSWRKFPYSFSFRTKCRQISEHGIHALVYQTPVIPFLKTLNHWRRDKLLKKLSKKYIEIYGKPDLVHAHGFYCGEEACRLKKTHNIPFVITEHYSVFAREMTNKHEKKRALQAYSESSFRIAVNYDFCKLLNRMFLLQFEYIPNIVNVNKFSLNLKKDKSLIFRFISVGALDQNKNQTTQIRALSLLKTSCTLTIVGSGPMKSQLQKLANDLGLCDRVIFADYVAHQLLEQHFQQADALIVSSKYETFGLVMIEAMSCGLPVVSSPVGEAPSLLKENNLGYLCRSSNHEHLAEGMNFVMNNKFDSEKIREHVIKEYSATTIAKRLVQVYSDLRF